MIRRAHASFSHFNCLKKLPGATVVLITLGMLWTAPGAVAQSIRGVVLEDTTRQPIAGVAVELIGAQGPSAQALSDSAGAFVLRTREVGRFVIRLSHPGYLTVASDSVVLAPGEMIAVQLTMGVRAIPLAPLVVTYRGSARRGGFYDRMFNTGNGHFLTRLDFDRPGAGAQVTDILQTVPGIHITSVARARGMSTSRLVTMRSGGGHCPPAIFIDGMPVRQLVDSSLDDILSTNVVEAVEIYAGSGGTPPQFTRPNTCGALVFWTRTGAEDEGSKLTVKRAWIATGVGAMMFALFKLF